MRQQLKASAKSSNFWTSMATLATVLSGALYAFLTSDPEAIKTMTVSQMMSTFFFHVGNTLLHLNKDK
jgi:hypothetical protein